MLSDVRDALDLLYGANAATLPRSVRREAEKTLLTLRRLPAAEAMAICTSLLTDGPASALFAAQTTAHLCRTQEPGDTGADAVLGLLRAAVAAGFSNAILTQFSLAVCALVGRLKAWPMVALVPTLRGALDGSPVLLELLTLLPEEIGSNHLALGGDLLDEVREQLCSSAAPAVVELCLATLGAADGGAAALRCLAAWAKGSILPWPTLAPAMDASIGATRAATELAPLQAGCDLLVAAAEADWEGDRSATSFGGARHLSAALALRPTFEAASAQAAHAAGSPHGAAPVDVAAALAGLYGSIGSCHLRRDTGERGGDAPPPAATAPEFAPLLELMLGALAHPSPEVVLPAVQFWARDAHLGDASVLCSHAAATRPLVAALVAACEFPPAFEARADLWDGYIEKKIEVRAAAAAVVAELLPSPPLLEAAGWLVETAATEAAALLSVADPLGPLLPLTDGQVLPPAALPSSDALPWRRLEAALHTLAALAPTVGADAAASAQLRQSTALARLLESLPALPPRRLLWRSAAAAASELGLALGDTPPPPLLVACTAHLARTFAVSADGDDDASDFTLPAAEGDGGGGGEPLHAGVASLRRLCSSAAAAARLAALDGVFDGVHEAYASCTGELRRLIFLLRRPTPASQRALQEAAGAADGDQAKVSALLSCACVLAAATAPAAAADERAQQLCAPLFAALRTVAAAPRPLPPPAVALAAVALRRLRTVATHAGSAQPGLLGALAADWVAFRAVAVALAAERRSKALRSLCGFLADALRHGGGAAPPLIEAVAQLSAELLRGGGGGGEAARPPPFVLAPLAAAVDRGAGAAPAAASEAAAAYPRWTRRSRRYSVRGSTPPSPSSSRSSPRRRRAHRRAARRRRVGGGAR